MCTRVSSRTPLEPLGMSGVRLETRVHIVTAAVPSAQNIIKCCDRCGLQVADLVLQPLASAEAVLHDDEKELGVALIDIGGGTTDISIFVKGSIVHTSVLPIGGAYLTNDIALGLRTPSNEAEKIKQKWGCALTTMVQPDEQVEVPSVGGRPPRRLPRRILCEIIQPRVEELFLLVKQEIDKTGFADLLASGAVITGGTVILEGMPEVAEELLELPVRRGSPRGIGGLVDVVRSPKFATSVGLVFRGAKQLEENQYNSRRDRPGFGNRVKELFARIF
jgi:cell division protein FtsA